MNSSNRSNGARGRGIYGAVAVISILLASCRTVDTRTVSHAQNPSVSIGVLFHTTGPILGAEARPKVTSCRRGQLVEWFSVDGTLDINFASSLSDPGCQQRRSGGYCSLLIPRDQPNGRYRYQLLVTLPDGTRFESDGELDISH